MFQRAHKIVITESSATKRSHPAVGDVGYLNNMYLFFVNRFILLDAFFFRYKSDIKKDNTRCERKRFIIDLGMKKSLKRKLAIYGLSRKFFLENKYVVNLTVSGHIISDNNLVAELPSINSLWYKRYNKDGNLKLKPLTKIPYGHISLAPDRKKPIQSDGPNALRCWIECLIPLIESSTVIRYGDELPDNSFNAKVSSVYRRTLSRYIHSRSDVNGLALTLHKNAPAGLGSMGERRVIVDMQMIHALARSFLNNCDTSILTHPLVNQGKRRFSSVWRNKGLTAIYNYPDISPTATKALTGLFFRSVIMPGDTEKKLLIMSQNGAMPWGFGVIKSKAKKFKNIKRAADFSSAALNRIFEEDLLS